MYVAFSSKSLPFRISQKQDLITSKRQVMVMSCTVKAILKSGQR
jgi:hypothetical protein